MREAETSTAQDSLPAASGVSNALDGLEGDIERTNITVEDGFINIADRWPGYPLVYAKRIGASSKRSDGTSIGQFGEGTKLALLACLRKNIEVRVVSREWLIKPRIAQAEEDGIEVLLFYIY